MKRLTLIDWQYITVTDAKRSTRAHYRMHETKDEIQLSVRCCYICCLFYVCSFSFVYFYYYPGCVVRACFPFMHVAALVPVAPVNMHHHTTIYHNSMPCA